MPLNWVDITTLTSFPDGVPPFKWYPHLAFDRARNRLVLYGGLTGSGTGVPAATAKTWELYGGSWHAVTTANYPIGFGTDATGSGGWLIYDEAREVCVGYVPRAGATAQTWEYDGNNWAQFMGSTPYRAAASSAVWDPIGEQIVMWGGTGATPPVSTGDPDYTYYTYNGTAWSSHTTANAPMYRDQVSLAYDQANNNIVMFGGYTGKTPPAAALRPNDTWTLNLSGTPNWTQKSPTVVPYYNNGTDEAGATIFGMTFDENLNKVLLFKNNAAWTINSTWLWDGSDWEVIGPTVEPPIAGPALGAVIYNPEYRRTQYYGGYVTTPAPEVESWLFPAPMWDGRIASMYLRLGKT